MSKYNLITIESIIAKLYREIKPISEIDEGDVIEMIGEALEAIGAFGQYEEDVCFIDIKNHRGDLPTGLVEIVQVAMSLQPVDTEQCINVEDNCACNKDPKCDRCNPLLDDEIVNDCWSQHNKYYIPEQRYLDVLSEYHIQSIFTPYYYNNFLPLRLSTNTFRSAVGLHNKESINLSITTSLSYSIQNNQIVTSQQEGTVALAYIRQPLDENGYPMIPDLQEYKEAITKYVLYKSAFERFYNNEPNFRGIYQQLEADWHWYCRQAKNRMMLPSTIDERENLKDINNRMLKIQRGYYGFFGNINTPETFRINGRRERY